MTSPRLRHLERMLGDFARNILPLHRPLHWRVLVVLHSARYSGLFDCGGHIVEANGMRVLAGYGSVAEGTVVAVVLG